MDVLRGMNAWWVVDGERCEMQAGTAERATNKKSEIVECAPGTQSHAPTRLCDFVFQSRTTGPVGRNVSLRAHGKAISSLVVICCG